MNTLANQCSVCGGASPGDERKPIASENRQNERQLSKIGSEMGPGSELFVLTFVGCSGGFQSCLVRGDPLKTDCSTTLSIVETTGSPRFGKQEISVPFSRLWRN